MVVCTFSPEIYSLTASVSVPNHLLKNLFDRIREKQVQALVSSRNDGHNLAGEARNNLTSNEKIGKIKRFSLRRHELRPFIAKQSHLRDSRMLAEDSRAKWLKQSNGWEGGEGGKFGATSLLTNKILMISSVLAMCAIGLLCFALKSRQRRASDKHGLPRGDMQLRNSACQQVPSVEPNIGHSTIASP